MPGVRLDHTKIRISREILSRGPGYRAFRSEWHSRDGEDITKRHMGRFVKMAYIPTSPEWEPPDYLLDHWWEIVNEAGNTVGLKAFIPLPKERDRYGRRSFGWRVSWQMFLFNTRCPWIPKPQGKLLTRAPSLVEWLLEWLTIGKLRR